MKMVWVHEDKQVLDGLAAISREIFSPRMETLGWTAKPDEHPLDTQLRALSIGMAGMSGNQE
jgi:hypothetical protein